MRMGVAAVVLMSMTACGGGGDGTHLVADAGPDALPAFGPCDLLAQTGCNPGDKCTWLVTQLTPNYVARIGCAPAGTVAVGATCTRPMPDGVDPAFDDCVAGAVCGNFRLGQGTCKQVCDVNAGLAPTCDAQHACISYDRLLTDSNGSAVAGVCDPRCSPLDDNDFDGNETTLTRSGTTCGPNNVGCYGNPSHGTGVFPTQWSCAPDLAYADNNYRHGATGMGFTNGCNQGYIPLRDNLCRAACKPGNTYQGNPGTQYPQGQSPHACNTTDARGNFNGTEQCVYLWRFEINAAGKFVRSSTSDTIGVCIADWPSCATLPLTAASGPVAADYGCVDTQTAPALPTTPISEF